MEQYGYNTKVFKDIFKVDEEYGDDILPNKWYTPFANWFILSAINRDAVKFLNMGIGPDELQEIKSVDDEGHIIITIPVEDDDDIVFTADCPTLKTFALIYNEYADCHVAFTDESFLDRFANDLYTFYKEFEQTTKAIDDLMNLSDNDISIADRMITNIANIPETTSSTDAEEVDYITQQQKSINKKGTLQVKKEQLSNKRAYTVRSFLNKFRHLFIKIISPTYNTVYIEEEGE